MGKPDSWWDIPWMQRTMGVKHLRRNWTYVQTYTLTAVVAFHSVLKAVDIACPRAKASILPRQDEIERHCSIPDKIMERTRTSSSFVITCYRWIRSTISTTQRYSDIECYDFKPNLKLGTIFFVQNYNLSLNIYRSHYTCYRMSHGCNNEIVILHWSVFNVSERNYAREEKKKNGTKTGK